jgi:hypothetical protein
MTEEAKQTPSGCVFVFLILLNLLTCGIILFWLLFGGFASLLATEDIFASLFVKRALPALVFAGISFWALSKNRRPIAIITGIFGVLSLYFIFAAQ